jgi:dihydrofolate reductase/thymidylate synthase
MLGESSRKFSIIVAVDDKNGIGVKGKLPWRLSEDMRHFRDTTIGDDPGLNNAVIMGRKTWESIPAKFRPLPRRHNVVITRNKTYELPDHACQAGSLADALFIGAHNLFVIGGGEIYKEAIRHPNCEGMYITRVRGDYECDTFFPEYESLFDKECVLETLNEGGVLYSIEHWLRK